MVEIVTAAIAGLATVLSALVLASQRRSEKKRADGQERMEIILECTAACLDGVHQLGANSTVTEAWERLKRYKDKKSAQ